MFRKPTTGRSDGLLNDDTLIFQEDLYVAVINHTTETVQSWGYGRRIVLVPNEMRDPHRACVQFVKRKLARKMVWNKRRFLEMTTVEQGKRLLRRARELGSFHAAYVELTGRDVKKAAETLRRERTKRMLMKQLDQLGINVNPKWSVEEMKAIVRDPTLSLDMDIGRPRPQETAGVQGPGDPELSNFFHQDPADRVLKDTGSVPMTGRRGDFVRFDDDDEAPPEATAARAALKGELQEDDDYVPPDKPATPPPAPKPAVASGPKAKSAALMTAEDLANKKAKELQKENEAAKLRQELTNLGVPVHPRSRDLIKLRAAVKQAREAAFAQG
jgi:hypothetical protein